MSSVRDFGARGDGKTDDTAALRHAVQRGDGHLVFPRGDYIISRPISCRCNCTAASLSPATAAWPESSWRERDTCTHLPDSDLTAGGFGLGSDGISS
jgi:polygalacturonase